PLKIGGETENVGPISSQTVGDGQRAIDPHQADALGTNAIKVKVHEAGNSVAANYDVRRADQKRPIDLVRQPRRKDIPRPLCPWKKLMRTTEVKNRAGVERQRSIEVPATLQLRSSAGIEIELAPWHDVDFAADRHAGKWIG